jgi:Cu-processing system ATP-binding protein
MIEIQHLTKRFGDFCAVDDISLRISEGETFALLGPNGSGKTTALKCLVGLIAPSAGRILVDRIDVWKREREARRLMSFLPQHVGFHETLTAREVLEFYCRLRKLPLDRVDRMLAHPTLNLNGSADRAVGQFSGGMIQRLGIAVALLPDAPVLILDEPTASLDPEGALRFREVLASLKQEGRTIIFSSHVLSDVNALADRVAIMVGGRMAALESVETLKNELLTNPEIHVRIEPSLEEVYLRYVHEKDAHYDAAHDDGVREPVAPAR